MINNSYKVKFNLNNWIIMKSFKDKSKKMKNNI